MKCSNTVEISTYSTVSWYLQPLLLTKMYVVIFRKYHKHINILTSKTQVIRKELIQPKKGSWIENSNKLKIWMNWKFNKMSYLVMWRNFTNQKKFSPKEFERLCNILNSWKPFFSLSSLLSTTTEVCLQSYQKVLKSPNRHWNHKISTL